MSPAGRRCSWANPAPSFLGFPPWAHPRDPQTIWTLPLNGDLEGGYPPDAVLPVDVFEPADRDRWHSDHLIASW